MMSKFRLLAALFVFSILSVGLTSVAEEKKKEYNESWPANSVESLEITNKFGEIEVVNEGGSEITIDVEITVEARDEKKADELLDKIEVIFTKSGSSLKAVTTIENNFKSQRKFSIDYRVNIPSDKDLKISNKYGNTVLSTLTGDGDFLIQYGDISANELSGENIKMVLEYGNSNVSSAKEINVDVQYSGMSFGEIGNLKLNSKYSSVEVEEGNTINITSKYDKFNFEEVESVSAVTKYSHLKIEELAKSLNVESGYGSIKVGEVDEGFESISVTNSYGKVYLGLSDIGYSVDAKCEYCGIAYPEDEFSGDSTKEKSTRTINGKVGSGPGGKVYVRSRYGEIVLTE